MAALTLNPISPLDSRPTGGKKYAKVWRFPGSASYDLANGFTFKASDLGFTTITNAVGGGCFMTAPGLGPLIAVLTVSVTGTTGVIRVYGGSAAGAPFQELANAFNFATYFGVMTVEGDSR